MNKLTFALSVLLCTVSLGVGAETAVELLPSRFASHGLPSARILADLRTRFDRNGLRAIKAQAIYDRNGHPDHLLVYLFPAHTHRVKFARVAVDEAYRFLAVQENYSLEASDREQQPGISADEVKCPDDSTELVAFAPNNDTLEQNVTKDVADHAQAAGLKTVRLLLSDATRANWLNYMACPKLRGNFYDGDADRQTVITVDGSVTASDFSTLLRHRFNYNVTNIWLACQAYNDPMLTAVQQDAQSRKYAAGINDLQVGPSDNAAACAMKAAIDGKPMTQSFQDCYKQFDNAADHWGFGGDGGDYF